MEDIRAINEFCILVGDLNKLVRNDILGVEGNHEEMSAGGGAVDGTLGHQRLGLGQWKQRGHGHRGSFTRVKPATCRQSCLDLFIVSRELVPNIDKLVIDSELKMAAAQVL